MLFELIRLSKILRRSHESPSLTAYYLFLQALEPWTRRYRAIRRANDDNTTVGITMNKKGLLDNIFRLTSAT